MDAAGSENAVLWMGGARTGIGVLFAATYPERCAGLVLFDPTVRPDLSPEGRLGGSGNAAWVT
jgi:pimeloyl-ACP methyl ester carboxylesterase